MSANETEKGFDELLKIFEQDPKWGDGAAKKKLFEFFDLLGLSDPNVVEARKKLSDLYNSEKNRIEFKLSPKDLMMMDNYRVLHGRTKFDPGEGKRFLQGCYIDFDSTEGKLRHLKRKFNI